MMNDDSTGGTSRRSGKPPVFFHDDFIEYLTDCGFILDDEQCVRSLAECYGFQRLAPYVEYLRRADMRNGLRCVSVIRDLVHFDEEVRLLLLRGIGLIESQLKIQYQRVMHEKHGAFCLYDPACFRNEKERGITLKAVAGEVRRQAKNNASARRIANSSCARVPVWIGVEAASLGVVRRLLDNTKDPEVIRRVSTSFSVNRRCFHSWLRTLALVRNCCAHFNPYVVRTQIPGVPKPVHGVEGDNASPMYALALVIRLLRGRAEAVRTESAWADYYAYVQSYERVMREFATTNKYVYKTLRIPDASMHLHRPKPYSASSDKLKPTVDYIVIRLAA